MKVSFDGERQRLHALVRHREKKCDMHFTCSGPAREEVRPGTRHPCELARLHNHDEWNRSYREDRTGSSRLKKGLQVSGGREYERNNKQREREEEAT